MVKRIAYMRFILHHFFIFTICAIVCWYGYIKYTRIPSYEKKLWPIMITAENNINNYLKEQENYTNTLATHPQTETFLKSINRNKSSLETITKNYETFIALQQEIMNFKNVFILDSNRTIQFSTKKSLIGKNINDDLYKNYPLNKSCERAMMTLSTDFAQFSLDPLLGKPALFITAPIIKNKKFVGILAYEYDPQNVYRFINQYIGLGTTGEIALAQKEESFIVFVAPTRHDPDLAFKKRSLFSRQPISIQASVLGRQGTGTAVDYRSQPVVAAWTFIPKVNWGMIVKIDQAEILQPLTTALELLALLLIIFILWCLYIEFFYDRPLTKKLSRISNSPPFNRIPRIAKNPYLLLLLISSSILIKTIINYQFDSTSVMQASQQEIIKDITQASTQIEQIIQKIVFIAESIAEDLQKNRLTHEDIDKRIKRNLAENNNIISITVAFSPYTYDNTTKLFAPSVIKDKNSYTNQNIADLYDYTDTNASNVQAGWYQQALHNSDAWIDPSTDNGKTTPPTYSHVFLDNNNQPTGVVSITYNIKPIVRIAEYSSLNRIGYSLLMTRNGRFLFHPVSTLVETEQTLLEYAKETGNEELAKIAIVALEKKSNLSSYTAPATQQQMWIYTHLIPINGWILGAIFPKNDVSLQPRTVRIYLFWILAYSILCALFLCAFIYNIRLISYIQMAFLINAFLISALLCAWHIIQETSTIERLDSTIITDQASLDKFLDDLQEETKRKNEEAPIPIPCGILLYSLDIPNTDHLTISGYLWNKYNIKDKKYENLTTRIQIPHAIRLSMGLPITSIDGDWETITRSIRSTIFQKQNYSYFPFDKQRMQITLEPHDIQKNIILTPDLASYKKISPEDMPGLDKSFTLSDFRIEQTFFNYKKIDPMANFGFKEYGKATDHFQLIYNIVTKRGLLNPFVLFFLPLLVVLFSLFSVLIIAKRESDPLTIIASYTGLFFALILLQRSLRESYPTNVTLYMEYAFFFAYISVILLVIHTMLIYLYPQWKSYQTTFFPLVKLLFWPFQLICWIITTFIVFY